MSEFPILRSQRLVLRSFRTEDAAAVRIYAGDFAVADTTTNIPHPYPEGAAEEWISIHESEWLIDKCITWAIVRLVDTQLIGAISLSLKQNEKAEIGYWIGRPFWGQGYCSEAARLVLEYGFNVKQLNRIYGYHFTRNPASGRVMQKIGMKQEGILRQQEKRWDKYEDLAVYGILRSEFQT